MSLLRSFMGLCFLVVLLSGSVDAMKKHKKNIFEESKSITLTDQLLQNKQYQELQDFLNSPQDTFGSIKERYAMLINSLTMMLQNLNAEQAITLFNQLQQEGLQSPTAVMALRLLIARMYSLNVDGISCSLFYKDIPINLNGQKNILFQQNHIQDVLLFIIHFKSDMMSIDLSCNQLTQLPDCIKFLKNLAMLAIHDNQLQQLPESLGELTNLQYFVVHNNPLQQLPNSLQNLANLKILNN